MQIARKIMLADDDDDDHLIFKDALTEIDPSIICTTAINGYDAMAKLNENETLPDVVFLDINMPLQNGFECLLALKAHHRFCNIPVVMFTTASNNSAIETARSLGADLFLSKPTDHRQLNYKLKKVFNILFADDYPIGDIPQGEFFI